MKLFIKCDECNNEFKVSGKIVLEAKGTTLHSIRCPICDKLYEIELSKFYKDRNYRTIYFKEKYVEHIGDKRHVHFSRKGRNSVLDFKIDRMIKKIRYKFLKLFGKVK